MNTHLFFDPNINVGTFREATLHGCPIAPLKSSNELSCYFCLSGIKVKAEISTTWGHQRKRDSLSSLRHSNEKRKKSSIATAVAATITARTQECAIGDQQCAAMCSASVHVIAIPKTSTTSPAQSSDRFSKGGVKAAR